MTSAKYVCTRRCYPGHLCRVGDIVDGRIASVIPDCFQPLQSTRPSEMEAEVNDLLSEEMEDRNYKPKMLTASDLRRPLPPIAGSEETKMNYNKPKIEPELDIDPDTEPEFMNQAEPMEERRPIKRTISIERKK